LVSPSAGFHAAPVPLQGAAEKDGLPIVMNDRVPDSDHWTRLRVNYWERAVYR
jgi:hypothetical protein